MIGNEKERLGSRRKIGKEEKGWKEGVMLGRRRKF